MMTGRDRRLCPTPRSAFFHLHPLGDAEADQLIIALHPGVALRNNVRYVGAAMGFRSTSKKSSRS